MYLLQYKTNLKTIEVSVLISCIASICHVYMKFLFKILKIQLFFLIVLEKYRKF